MERTETGQYNPGLASLGCTTEDDLFVGLSASSDGTYNSVSFGVDIDFVRYRPAHEYGPVASLGKRQVDSSGSVVDDPVDDPYWSH
ncbi:hypothetical protein [Kitasatospora sp. NPDC090091]|uniref:hypothetical protein n=1 Tax=Kitasatospora sp. NPDC090091 TaxID=3364081 RepID=UPI00381C0737